MIRPWSGFLIVLVLIASLSLGAIPFNTMAETSDLDSIGRVSVPGVDWISENFLTTSRCDSGNTNASGWGTGDVTCQRDYTVARLDQFLVSGGFQAVDVQGRNAYIAAYATDPWVVQVLRIVNLTTPSNVVQLTAWNWTWTSVYDVKVAGDILYAVSMYGDLGLYNVSNPHTVPALTDRLPNFGGTRPRIDVQGRFLYGACDALRIVNIEDPYNIKLVSTTSLPTGAYDVDVVGDMAYLALGNGFCIVNVSNPYSPSMIAQITGGTSTRIHVDGSIAYLISWSLIQLIDIRDPYNPTVLGSYNFANNLQSLALQGHTLYLGDDSGNIAILDVVDPRHPTYVDEFSPVTASVNDLAFYDGDLVIATSASLETYRVGVSSDGLTTLPLLGSFSGYPVMDVAVEGDVAYVAAGPEGLLTLNVSDPITPVLLDQINHATPVEYDSVVIQGHYCFVADDGGSLEEGLLTFNVTDPSNLQFLDNYPVADINDVAVVGDVAYLAAGNDGLYLINVTDPTTLSTKISNYTDGNSYWDLWVQGHFVYATAMHSTPPWDFSFLIFDATNLSHLVLTNYTTKPFSLTDVAVEGDICVLAESDRGISLQNVTNPFEVSPFSLYDLPANNISTGVVIFGPYIIVTEGFGGVHLLNATDPRHPQLITSYNTFPMTAATSTIEGDFLYVANGTSLMIHRLFRSPANTYKVSNVVAQSVDVHNDPRLIENATLTGHVFLPSYTSVAWQLSADGGTHWETTTLGFLHKFTYRGNDLRWRIILSTDYDDRTPHLYQLDLTWYYNDPPINPLLNTPDDPDGDGAFTVSWSAGWDYDGYIVSYQLQMSNASDFTHILQEWTPTVMSQDVSGLIGITYYFRVRAFDNDGVPSSWSNVESITVANQPPTTPILSDPGDVDEDGVFTVSWSSSTDPEGTLIKYILEVSDLESMDSVLRSWETGETSMGVNITEFGSGTYYFAVIAEDEDIIRSEWSNVESITVELPTIPTTTSPPPIPGFPVEAVILGLLSSLILLLLVRRRNQKKP